MFEASLGQIAFLLGALGLFVGAVALIVAIEVARRSQEYLRKHAQEMSLTLSKRIQDQDQHLGKELNNFLNRIQEMEETEKGRDRALAETRQNLESRFASQEGILLERQKLQADTLTGFERNIEAHAKQLNGIRNVLQTIAQDIERLRDAPKQGVPMYDLPPGTRRDN